MSTADYWGWVVVPNEGYTDTTPHPLTAACHDGTPFLSIRCSCSYELHLHESQIEGMPAETEVATRCHGCGEMLVFPPGWFQEGFQSLREEGWIA